MGSAWPAGGTVLSILPTQRAGRGIAPKRLREGRLVAKAHATGNSVQLERRIGEQRLDELPDDRFLNRTKRRPFCFESTLQTSLAHPQASRHKKLSVPHLPQLSCQLLAEAWPRPSGALLHHPLSAVRAALGEAGPHAPRPERERPPAPRAHGLGRLHARVHQPWWRLATAPKMPWHATVQWSVRYRLP